MQQQIGSLEDFEEEDEFLETDSHGAVEKSRKRRLLHAGQGCRFGQSNAFVQTITYELAYLYCPSIVRQTGLATPCEWADYRQHS